jgi:hypothetical protein
MRTRRCRIVSCRTNGQTENCVVDSTPLNLWRPVSAVLTTRELMTRCDSCGHGSTAAIDPEGGTFAPANVGGLAGDTDA